MLMNKSELARRIGCNRRVIDKYIKESIRNPAVPKSKREYSSMLDPYRKQGDRCGVWETRHLFISNWVSGFMKNIIRVFMFAQTSV